MNNLIDCSSNCHPLCFGEFSLRQSSNILLQVFAVRLLEVLQTG